MSDEQIAVLEELGARIRALKADGAAKEDVMSEVSKLNDAKVSAAPEIQAKLERLEAERTTGASSGALCTHMHGLSWRHVPLFRSRARDCRRDCAPGAPPPAHDDRSAQDSAEEREEGEKETEGRLAR